MAYIVMVNEIVKVVNDIYAKKLFWQHTFLWLMKQKKWSIAWLNLYLHKTTPPYFKKKKN